MTNEVFGNAHGQKIAKSSFYPSRYFQLISAIAIIVILVVAVMGSGFVFRRLVLYEAERDAVRISAALRDSQIDQFIQQNGEKKLLLSVPQNELPNLDKRIRIFLAPFDIIKIKVFNINSEIIYSTDSRIIGRLDTNNAKLATALSGSLISKYESKDSVWDLGDEERKDVEIVETYIPIHGPDGIIVGSFEIYKDVTHDLAMANTILLRAGAVLSVTVLIVFGVLMFVIRRATRTINSGTADLTAANKQLQQEIVERRQIEQSLRETQERFRDFFKNAPVGFHIFGPDRIIMDINDAELKMIGYTKDEIVGKKTWADLILPEQITKFEKHWHDITTKGKVRNLKYILVRKDGHQIDVLLNASARFDAKGNLISTRGSVLNITDRKRLEKEFLNIIERERRRIGQELHDSIGQRLTGIEFMTDVLEQKLSDKSLQEAPYAAKITAIVKETTARVRDLAKMLHPLALSETNLKLALEELAATTGSLFNISCTFRCDKFVAPNGISVAINLYRIAQEALTNAIRHGKAKNIHIELASNRDRSMLTVKNDGLDFPEVLDKNKGIGLKIMEYRADMIDGSLNIHRGLSGGTIVTCAFPRK